jgi:hypothetical protein
VNPDVIRSITGHETLSMMSRYNITDERDQRAALRIMHAYRQEQDQEQARQLTREAFIRVNLRNPDTTRTLRKGTDHPVPSTY